MKKQIFRNRLPKEIDYEIFLEKEAIENSENQTCLNAYALTVMFNTNNNFSNINSMHELKFIKQKFKELYLETCKLQFGKRYARFQKTLQTQIHSFIDVSGTRYGSKNETNLGDNPHIHAIIIPDKSQEFKWSQASFLDEIRNIFESKTYVRSIELKRTERRDDVKRFTGYAAKYYIRNINNQKYSDQLYTVYPEHVA